MTALAPIVISGSIAIDRIMSFDGRYSDYIQLEKLDSLSISIFLRSLEDKHGGVGANIAYTLGLLGAKPFLVGSVGPDGSAYIHNLAALGINTDHVFESELPTATFNVITDSDENQVGGFYPGAMFDSNSLTLEPWKDLHPIVVVSPHDPAGMKRQVAQCKRWGLKLCYDVGQQVSNLSSDDLAAGLETANVLILNDYEMSAIATKVGRTTQDIKTQIPVVVTTLGKHGSQVEGADVPTLIKVGIALPRAVADPTGAGDAYRSGFLLGLANGQDYVTCAQLGAVCGSFAIEHVGTQSHTFTLSQFAERYKTTFHQPLPNIVNELNRR